MYNEKIAKIAICILAVTYRWVYTIQECSEYALMLVCLFGMIYFYVRAMNRTNMFNTIIFILFGVLAIYSQYGSIFVVLPLYLTFYVSIILNKNVNKRRKVILTVSYFISFIVFAIPLYIFFLKAQMASNEIEGNRLHFDSVMLKEMPFMLGQITGFMFAVWSENSWQTVLSIFSLCLFASIFCYLMSNKKEKLEVCLIISLLLCYVMHYLLTKFHIYAMVHPNQSAGFFSRYSNFYIPILGVTLPLLLQNIISFANKFLKHIINIALISVVILSFFVVFCNWNKALDDIFAKVWMANKGYESTTYMLGAYVRESSQYYISHLDDYADGDLDNVVYDKINYDELPDKFWVWRTNWSGEYEWSTVMSKAKEMGYYINVFYDTEHGQLAYFDIDGNKVDFKKEYYSLGNYRITK